MKLRYPAEAFALGIILFSSGMKEAFAAGILVIFTSVFAELLKNLLEKAVPAWSLRLCVLIASGSVCASAFLIGFTALGITLTNGQWIILFLTGLLCARHALSGNTEGEYGELLFESAIAWGLWILFSICREFLGSGNIFGNTVFTASFQSKALLGPAFAFMTAGLVTAAVNRILKKGCKGLNSLFPALPAMVLFHPFTVDSFAGLPGTLWVIFVPVFLFLSVKQTIKFARTGRFFRGLPVEMLAAGFIYMILSIY